MLKKASIAFVALCVLGGAYEFTLRGKDILGGRKVLRIAAAGWMITEFKLHKHAEQFRAEHPELDVILHQTPTGFDTHLMLQASLGDVPYDLVLGPSNYSVELYWMRDLAVALDDMMPAELRRKIFPAMLRASRAGSNTYLLPFMGEVEVLNFRPEMFEQAGLTRPPRTWQEFEEYAEKLTDASADKPRYGISLCLAQNMFFLQNTYLVLLRSIRGSVVDEDGHLDLSSPESREVFRMLKRWWKKGLISPACKSKHGAVKDFNSGITAMFPNWQSRGLWAIRMGLGGPVAFAPLPESHKEGVGSLFAIHGGIILKGTKMRKEAAEFLFHVMLGNAQTDIIQAGKMPVTTDKYTRQHVADWMVEVGRTLASSYGAPEPRHFAEMAEQHVAPAFHQYLASDSDDPAPFLERARRGIERRVYDLRP